MGAFFWLSRSKSAAKPLSRSFYRANLKGDQRCAYLVENQDASPHLIICEGTSNTGVEA